VPDLQLGQGPHGGAREQRQHSQRPVLMAEHGESDEAQEGAGADQGEKEEQCPEDGPDAHPVVGEPALDGRQRRVVDGAGAPPRARRGTHRCRAVGAG
jgi:hypothetical protein